METPKKSPLAPLTFTDNRDSAQQTVDLTFVPTNVDLLKAYEKLWVDSYDFFGSVHSPIYTASQLFRYWLKQRLEKGEHIDKEMVAAAFELIDYLDIIRNHTLQVEFYTDQAKEAVDYVEKEVSHD